MCPTPEPWDAQPSLQLQVAGFGNFSASSDELLCLCFVCVVLVFHRGTVQGEEACEQ